MKYEEEMARECTFNPRIDNHSRHIVKNKPGFNGFVSGPTLSLRGNL